MLSPHPRSVGKSLPISEPHSFLICKVGSMTLVLQTY